jgi:ribosomal protein L7/L12
MFPEPLPIPLLLGALVLGIVIGWVLRGMVAPRDDTPDTGFGTSSAVTLDGTRRPRSDLLDAEVRDLLFSGRKIEAVKHYREATGVGLKEAKDAVEALERGANSPYPAVSVGGAPAGDWIDEVRALARAGKKIDAIKLYRERTGLGLKESKDAVEAL